MFGGLSHQLSDFFSFFFFFFFFFSDFFFFFFFCVLPFGATNHYFYCLCQKVASTKNVIFI